MTPWPGIVNAEVLDSAELITPSGTVLTVDSWMLRLQLEGNKVLMLPLTGLLAAAGPIIDEAMEHLDSRPQPKEQS
jgi:hypothetical protein